MVEISKHIFKELLLHYSHFVHCLRVSCHSFNRFFFFYFQIRSVFLIIYEKLFERLYVKRSIYRHQNPNKQTVSYSNLNVNDYYKCEIKGPGNRVLCRVKMLNSMTILTIFDFQTSNTRWNRRKWDFFVENINGMGTKYVAPQ